MAKNRKRKKNTPKQQKVVKPGFPLSRNLIVVLAAVLLFYILINIVPGYNQLWNNLVIRNLEVIFKNPDVSRDQKLKAKEKLDASYIIYLRKQTPDSAVILMPPKDTIKNNKENFRRIMNKAWCTFILYPRRIVYYDEKETDPNYKRVNYVAIFNYWGYDKLHYKVKTHLQYYVRPINK